MADVSSSAELREVDGHDDHDEADDRQFVRGKILTPTGAKVDPIATTGWKAGDTPLRQLVCIPAGIGKNTALTAISRASWQTSGNRSDKLEARVDWLLPPPGRASASRQGLCPTPIPAENTHFKYGDHCHPGERSARPGGKGGLRNSAHWPPGASGDARAPLQRQLAAGVKYFAP
jgi:hypothetical protein